MNPLEVMFILISIAYAAIMAWVVHCTWLTDKCRK